MKACIWCDALVEFGQGPSVRPAWKRWKCKGCGVFGYINLFSVTALIGILNNAGFKNIKRGAIQKSGKISLK